VSGEAEFLEIGASLLRTLLPPVKAIRLLGLGLSSLGEGENAGKRIFPRPRDWFAALDLTPLDEVRVVILGQDPYHGAGQAHGLCFSVRPGVRAPPSLANIYKEMQSDLGIAAAPHGCLDHWARQGVLLLNAVLTVEMGLAASHQGRGWERFTDAVIRLVNARAEPVVFMPMRGPPRSLERLRPLAALGS
jgi:uracil-DNA glycosylase